MIPRRAQRALMQLVLVAMAVVSLYPVWFVVQTALKSNRGYTLSPTGLPTQPTLENLRRVLFDLPVPRWALNSVIVTFASVTATTLIAMLAAYAIVFSTMRGRDLLLNANLALMVIPPVALLVPMFVLMVDLGLINTLPAVIVFYCGLMLPFSVFFFVNFFRQFPRELIEAATIDAASPFTTLRLIVLPISATATFTLVIVNAIWAWNELLIALVFLQDENRRTLMAGLTLFQGRYATNQPLVLAGVLISILPVVLVYLAGQRFFVRGMTAGIGK
jgi:ABC-type glycerol-3-phosphate transport system permease component